MNRTLCAFILNLFFLFSGFSVFGKVIPFNSEDWVFEAREHRLEKYKGHNALFLKGGVAYLKNAELLDGVIEFDIAIPDEFGFMGAIWRAQDLKNYEEFYLRSHRSGKPDANQYSPIFNELSAWQLYHGSGFSAPTVYKFDTWMHIKINVSGNKGAVYIMDMKKPAFIINEFKRAAKAGTLGLKVTDFAPARFANFQYTKSAEPIISTDQTPAQKAENGTVLNYLISSEFDEKRLENITSLRNNDLKNLSFANFQTEDSGLANLARIAQISIGNTVFAKIVIASETEQVKKMQFGYSDRIIVFLNERPLYSGTNVWRSRDFRYLGTIGYFDEVYLHLNKGDNEIMLAVSEGFGGWGLQTRFPNTAGITIK